MKIWLSDVDVTLNNGMGIAVHLKAGVRGPLHPSLHDDAIAAGVNMLDLDEDVVDEEPVRRSRKPKAD